MWPRSRDADCGSHENTGAEHPPKVPSPPLYYPACQKPPSSSAQVGWTAIFGLNFVLIAANFLYILLCVKDNKKPAAAGTSGQSDSLLTFLLNNDILFLQAAEKSPPRYFLHIPTLCLGDLTIKPIAQSEHNDHRQRPSSGKPLLLATLLSLAIFFLNFGQDPLWYLFFR